MSRLSGGCGPSSACTHLNLNPLHAFWGLHVLASHGRGLNQVAQHQLLQENRETSCASVWRGTVTPACPCVHWIHTLGCAPVPVYTGHIHCGMHTSLCTLDTLRCAPVPVYTGYTAVCICSTLPTAWIWLFQLSRGCEHATK